MTLQHFNQLISERNNKGTLYLDGNVSQDILDLFKKNAEQLKKDFFERAEKDLQQNKSSILAILTVYPFNEQLDKERFQKLVIDTIEKIENGNNVSNIVELSNYLWGLLDHMLHDWVISDENILMNKLRGFRDRLEQIEPLTDVYLLKQKLGHFGIK